MCPQVKCCTLPHHHSIPLTVRSIPPKSPLHPNPPAACQGLRMLIGAAQMAAAPRGMVLEPLFSYYSYHGPVFRVMLRVTRSKQWPAQQVGAGAGWAMLALCG